MKKVIIYIVMLLVLFVFGRQIYWVINEGGNVIIYVTNESNIDSVTIDIDIDGEVVFSENYSNKKLYDYKHLSMFKPVGTHNVKVTVKGKAVSKSKKFTVLGVTWINVEFIDDQFNSNSYLVNLFVGSKPIVFE